MPKAGLTLKGFLTLAITTVIVSGLALFPLFYGDPLNGLHDDEQIPLLAEKRHHFPEEADSPFRVLLVNAEESCARP